MISLSPFSKLLRTFCFATRVTFFFSIFFLSRKFGFFPWYLYRAWVEIPAARQASWSLASYMYACSSFAIAVGVSVVGRPPMPFFGPRFPMGVRSTRG